MTDNAATGASASHPTVLMAVTGPELSTRDFASAILRQGWRPVIFTPPPSRFEDFLRRASLPVVHDLSDMTVVPDVIHGHHGIETLAALFRFPSTPAVFVCHDAITWHSIPPRLQRIRAYVAVDENCRDRMVCEYGLPADRTRIMANSIDLRRFAPRGPLPPRPARALVFSHGATEYTYVPAIRSACAARGIAVDVVGSGVGRPTDEPERLLPGYDLVFAKARCALEALAVGAAVILCDAGGLGTLVTSADVEPLRRMNFGARTLQRRATAESVGAEIDRYDPLDAARVSAAIREAADVDLLAMQFVALYDEVRHAADGCDPLEEMAGASQYLTRAASRLSVQVGARFETPAARLRRRLLVTRPLAPLLRAVYPWLRQRSR